MCSAPSSKQFSKSYKAQRPSLKILYTAIDMQLIQTQWSFPQVVTLFSLKSPFIHDPFCPSKFLEHHLNSLIAFKCWVSHDLALISTCSRSWNSRRSISASNQSVQTETLEGSEEGIILYWGRFSGRGGVLHARERATNVGFGYWPGKIFVFSLILLLTYPREAVVAPEVSRSDSPFSIFLG